MRTTILAVLCGIGVIIIEKYAVAVKANLSSWLDVMGINHEWADIDLMLRIPIYTTLLVCVFFLIRRKTSPDKATVSTIDNSVKSENQSGGITARNVTIGSIQRTLDKKTKHAILQSLDKSKPVDISVAMNGKEADIFAHEIKQFLNSQGYSLMFETMLYESMSGGRGIPYLGFDKDSCYVTVGPNVNISDQISFLGSASRPLN